MSRSHSILVVFSVLLWAGPAMAEPQVWRDDALGLSLTVPEGAKVVDALQNEAVVRFVGPGGKGDYVITVLVRESPEPVTITQVRDTAIVEVAAAAADARVLSRDLVSVKDWPAVLLYYRHSDRPRNPLEMGDPKKRVAAQPWIMGQAFVQISPVVIVLLQLDVDEYRQESGKKALEALYKSLTMQDIAAADEQRKRLADNFKEWRKTITPERVLAVCMPDQLFRIRQNNLDIGYMRIRQAPAEEMRVKGVRIDVQSRVMAGARAVDTLSNFFVANDDSTEVWQTRVTERDPNVAEKKDASAVSTSETGVRSRDVLARLEEITVNREDPLGLKEYRWLRPLEMPEPAAAPPAGEAAPAVEPAAQPVAGAPAPKILVDPRNPPLPMPLGTTYVSQAFFQLIGPLLAGSAVTEMGYYAYLSASRKITFHTETIERNADGSYVVRSKPSPDAPEFVTRYDTSGRLVSQLLPDKTELIPATAAELSARWQLR